MRCVLWDDVASSASPWLEYCNTKPSRGVAHGQEDALHWRVEDIGNLCVALNALFRVFRLE